MFEILGALFCGVVGVGMLGANDRRKINSVPGYIYPQGQTDADKATRFLTESDLELMVGHPIYNVEGYKAARKIVYHTYILKDGDLTWDLSEKNK